MLRFWHVCLLVLIALIWKVRPSSTVDICESQGINFGVYCACTPQPRNKVEITCFIVRNNISDADPLWHTFSTVKNIIALTILSRDSSRLLSISTETLQNLEFLETLTIREGNLGEIESGTITNLTSLSVLHLERNEITSLHRNSFTNLPNLMKLTLSENLLTEILADSFADLDNLRNLYLDQNKIFRIESCGFCNLHSLLELDLNSNKLKDITESAFTGLRYVSRLDLRFNQIRVLSDKVFKAMPKLIELHLEENVIDYISPRAFYGLNELRELRLNHNKLKMLPDHVFQPLPELFTLSLSHNVLETVQSGVAESLQKALKEHFVFLFADNPLQCSCDLSWIPRFHEKAKSKSFKNILGSVQCENDTESVIVHTMKFKECKEIEKKNKAISINPTLSTLEPKFKGNVDQVNPKYETEFSDSSTLINHTSQKSEIKDGNKDNRGNVATSVPINISLLWIIVFQAIIEIRILL